MPVIQEYKKVKREWPEFMQVLQDTRMEAASMAKQAWGLEDGGFFPSSKQFGETPIRPRYVQIGTTTGRETWNRNLTTAGWQDVVNNNVIEDVYLGIVGFCLPNQSNKLAQIRIEAGDQKLPVINLEGEIDVMTEPIVIFDKGLVIPEEMPLLIRGYAVTAGWQVIKPFGFALAKQRVLIAETPT
jgi:hypothetical protein